MSCEFHSMEEDNLGEEANRVFGQIWKSPAPSKVIALSWKGLLDRIPTRTNLARRNVLEPSASLLCALCNDVDESTNHLFLHCTKTWKVWSEIKNWLELNFITPFNLFDHWECWDGYSTNSKELKRGLRLIWQAVVWVIWSVRNNVIFNNGVVEVDYMVEEIKRLSWTWSLTRTKIQPCLFYEWHWNPKWCLGLLRGS